MRNNINRLCYNCPTICGSVAQCAGAPFLRRLRSAGREFDTRRGCAVVPLGKALYTNYLCLADSYKQQICQTGQIIKNRNIGYVNSESGCGHCFQHLTIQFVVPHRRIKKKKERKKERIYSPIYIYSIAINDVPEVLRNFKWSYLLNYKWYKDQTDII